MEEIWLEIDAFHEQIVARSSRFSANDKDSAIEHAFKEKVSLETLFKCLDDASDTQNSSRVKTVCACIDHLLSCNAVDPQFFQSKQVSEHSSSTFCWRLTHMLKDISLHFRGPSPSRRTSSGADTCAGGSSIVQEQSIKNAIGEWSAGGTLTSVMESLFR